MPTAVAAAHALTHISANVNIFIMFWEQPTNRLFDPPLLFHKILFSFPLQRKENEQRYSKSYTLEFHVLKCAPI